MPQEIGKIPSMMEAVLTAQHDYSKAEAAVATHESILHHMCSDLSTWASWKSVDQQIKRIDDLKQQAFCKLLEVGRLGDIQSQVFRPNLPNMWRNM